MSVKVHATAVIEPGAFLGGDVEIGPYAVVGPHVVLKDRVKLFSHVVISGRTTLEKECVVYPFASIGHAPQDLKYQGEDSTLEIGARTIIREHVTIQPGTRGDQMTTRVGRHCLLMVGSHVAHDCQVGNHVILSNNATLGGHVYVGDYAIIGGLAAIHQFVHIGAHAMVGGTCGVTNDVIPYGLVSPGRQTYLEGLNLIGLKRRQFDSSDIQALRDAHRHLFQENHGTLQERWENLPPSLFESDLVQRLVSFLQRDRSICMPRHSDVL